MPRSNRAVQRLPGPSNGLCAVAKPAGTGGASAAMFALVVAEGALDLVGQRFEQIRER